MNILYLINGLGFSHNTGIGGSDKRAIEIIRSLKKDNSNSKFDILTTKSGHNLFFNSESLETNYYIIKKPFLWPNLINKSIVGRVLSYLHATAVSLFRYKQAKKYDLYFASSDFFFDVIPGWFYKKVHSKKLICMIHHHIASPKARGGSLVINVFMYLSQTFSFWLISKSADAIFLYDTEEGRKIKKILDKKVRNRNIQYYFVKNGINSKVIDKVKKQEKMYEACFLGGLRYSKGIKEFVPIWKRVTCAFSNAKFIVIGGGSSKIVEGLKNDIEKSNLQKNILLLGPISGEELFEKIKSSKIFLFPSHEEGWGIALCEAMYCGLPIVCYDLPAFKTFGNALDKYEVGDHEKLADKIIDYLNNPQNIKQKEERLVKTAEKYTWNKIALEEILIYKEIINSN